MKKTLLFGLVVAMVAASGANAGWREKLGIKAPAAAPEVAKPAPAPVVEEPAVTAEVAPVDEVVVNEATESVGGFVPNSEPEMVESEMEYDIVEE
ncbi:MAG: hypothetical protein J6T57_03285 [Alphaproteobacteria bacterium]|nr:hypothetical protein [Alphaproteobacteria bacterium]